jgi:Protein of unknown function (DUF4230)
MAKEGGVIRSGLKLGVAAAVVLLVAVGLGRVGLLPSISNPFRTEREQRDLPSILHELEDASEYTAASANVETSFEIEDESVLPDFLLGESVTFQAYGSVDGVVDFTRLTEDAIVVDGDRVTVTLPEPRLDNVHVDPDQSQVLDTDRGLLDRIGDVFQDDAVNEEELYSVAEDRLVEAATDSDLLDRARQNSREFIEGLVTGLGYEDVRVVFETPNSDQT